MSEDHYKLCESKHGYCSCRRAGTVLCASIAKMPIPDKIPPKPKRTIAPMDTTPRTRADDPHYATPTMDYPSTGYGTPTILRGELNSILFHGGGELLDRVRSRQDVLSMKELLMFMNVNRIYPRNRDEAQHFYHEMRVFLKDETMGQALDYLIYVLRKEFP